MTAKIVEHPVQTNFPRQYTKPWTNTLNLEKAQEKVKMGCGHFPGQRTDRATKAGDNAYTPFTAL